MSNNKTDRIILAAKKRATISSILSAAVDVVTFNDLWNNERIKELGFINDPALRNCLQEMKKGGLIRNEKNAKGIRGYILVKPASSKITKQVKINKVATKLDTIVDKDVVKTNLKIDIIKSTGRVRLELNGLFIEIGVI
jgi:hypothetical protein